MVPITHRLSTPICPTSPHQHTHHPQTTHPTPPTAHHRMIRNEVPSTCANGTVRAIFPAIDSLDKHKLSLLFWAQTRETDMPGKGKHNRDAARTYRTENKIKNTHAKRNDTQTFGKLIEIARRAYSAHSSAASHPRHYIYIRKAHAIGLTILFGQKEDFGRCSVFAH